ncbi:MAG: glycosyltransferase family 4 protein [Anaerolineae bacterium]|nr:glycosyltransferase family 4 protein [Anaerolineae bacterium]MDW8172961.1 glycosyltransferase family 4 protein [Anaerolineae bacterium]
MPSSTRLSGHSVQIILVTTQYVTEARTRHGGIAVQLSHMAQALKAEGHAVRVLVESTEGSEVLQHEEIIVERLRRPRWVERLVGLGRYRPLRPVPLNAPLIAYSFWRASTRRLLALQAAGQLDAVLFADAGAAIFGAPGLHTPQILWITSHYPTYQRLNVGRKTLEYRLMNALVGRRYRLATRLYANSPLTAALVARDYRAQARVLPPIFVLQAVQRDERLRREQSSPYLLYFGRLEPLKGVHELAQALPALLAAHPQARAVFVGQDRRGKAGPSTRAELEALLGDHRSRVSFYDSQPHSALYPLIEGARLVVLPSHIENLSNAAMETMGLGRPLVGTRGASFDEFIEDGLNGFLAPIGDADALSAVILRAWSLDDATLEQVGQRARQTISERFAPHLLAQALLEWWAEADPQR